MDGCAMSIRRSSISSSRLPLRIDGGNILNSIRNRKGRTVLPVMMQKLFGYVGSSGTCPSCGGANSTLGPICSDCNSGNFGVDDTTISKEDTRLFESRSVDELEDPDIRGMYIWLTRKDMV